MKDVDDDSLNVVQKERLEYMVNLVANNLSSGEKPSRRLSVSLKRTQEHVQKQNPPPVDSKDEQTSPLGSNKSKKQKH